MGNLIAKCLLFDALIARKRINKKLAKRAFQRELNRRMQMEYLKNMQMTIPPDSADAATAITYLTETSRITRGKSVTFDLPHSNRSQRFSRPKFCPSARRKGICLGKLPTTLQSSELSSSETDTSDFYFDPNGRPSAVRRTNPSIPPDILMALARLANGGQDNSSDASRKTVITGEGKFDDKTPFYTSLSNFSDEKSDPEGMYEYLSGSSQSAKEELMCPDMSGSSDDIDSEMDQEEYYEYGLQRSEDSAVSDRDRYAKISRYFYFIF